MNSRRRGSVAGRNSRPDVRVLREAAKERNAAAGLRGLTARSTRLRAADDGESLGSTSRLGGQFVMRVTAGSP
ncbi:MAG TPA: hypothetical protein VIK41_15920 [Gemmatimonadaceae bacterium]